MAVYLNEEYVGADAELVGFPHLLLCMGLVVVANKKMYGVHLTNTSRTEETVTAFKEFLTGQGVTGSTADVIYGSANYVVRYGDGKVSSWSNEMKVIGRMLAYSGEARGFDTSIIEPKDGTYVEYRLKTTGDCQIFYKRNEKMDYGKLAEMPNVQKITAAGKLRAVSVYSPSSATGHSSKLHTGKLHEVDYALRLNKVTL